MSEQRFSSGELGGFGRDVHDAVEMGRLLQAAIDESAMSLPGASTGFDAATEARGGLGDRVMAALADEPAPTPTGFLLPLRRRGLLRGLRASVRQAWVGLGGSGRPFGARAAALAYVLVVAIAGVALTGAATIGAGSLLGIVNQPTEKPPPTQPLPSPIPPTEQPTLPPTTPPDSSIDPFPSPSESPEASDDHGGSGAEPSDDHGGSGSDSTDDHGGSSGSDDSTSFDDSSGSGSGSDSGSSTPKPSATPTASGTPKPSETPH